MELLCPGPGPQIAVGKVQGESRFFRGVFKTVLICPQLSLVFPLIAPCPVLSSCWARGLSRAPQALLSLATLTAFAPHSRHHLPPGSTAGSGLQRDPSAPHLAGPTPTGMHKAAGWKETRAPRGVGGWFLLGMELTLSLP